MARILLIDDDDSVRTVLRLILVQYGHVVIEARNGKEGTNLFPQAKADLLITDIVMPEKEGLEVLIEIRKSHPSAKIIVISGGGRLNPADNLRVAKYLGATAVLAKPISGEALIAAVNDVLKLRGEAPAAS